VLGAGKNQRPLAAMGGSVRVRLEDSLWLGPSQLAKSNAAQVTNVRQIVKGLWLEIATHDEARDTGTEIRRSGWFLALPVTSQCATIVSVIAIAGSTGSNDRQIPKILLARNLQTLRPAPATRVSVPPFNTFCQS
jgi:hypothetical protein